jgi:hypothetical protein
MTAAVLSERAALGTATGAAKAPRTMEREKITTTVFLNMMDDVSMKRSGVCKVREGADEREVEVSWMNV